ncbi:hypothetical protein [Hymenobacter radiodurans]|nr:hypothetical protein [Hymenobacter radiodurans]
MTLATRDLPPARYQRYANFFRRVLIQQPSSPPAYSSSAMIVNIGYR